MGMSWGNEIETKLKEIEQAHLYRSLKVSSGVSFTHNDYLGLSTHPELREAAVEALDVYGAGSRGSRLLGGHSSLFERCEESIARFFGAPDAILFSSGYLANLGAVQTLGECANHIYSDEKNHASLVDGMRLTRLDKTIVPHSQWVELTKTVPKSLFVAESLYSMDGDVLDSASFTKAVKAANGFALIDEAHAAGVFMESGRGLCEKIGLEWDEHARTVCFGKAFGVQGAAILCSKPLKQLLVNRARTFIYSTAPSPVVVSMIQKSLEIVGSAKELRKELWERALIVRAALKDFLPQSRSDWEARSPIIPVLVPGEEKALRLEQNMRQIGVDVRAIRYPTVQKGSERLRISLNLHVSRENVELMKAALLSELKKKSE